MLEFVTERTSVWERLRAAKKPVLLYGMGNGADKILAMFQQLDIPCAGVFASDGFVRGHSFHGFEVISYNEARRRYGDFIVVLSFAVYRPELLERMAELDRVHEFYAPDVPVIGDRVFTPYYMDNHKEEIHAVYDLLADERSKQVFASVLNFKISGKISYLQEITSPAEEVYRELLLPQREESYLDLGAYNGDTVREFITHTPDYREIIALEPDSKNFRKLTDWLQKEQLRACTAYNCAVWSEPTTLPFQKKAGRNSALGAEGGVMVQAESIDHLLNGRAVSLVKMDVEGAEAEALRGGVQTLREYAPKLNIAVYHRSEDIFSLPLLVHQINPDYRLYLRHHPYIPAWETNLYCRVEPSGM